MNRRGLLAIGLSLLLAGPVLAKHHHGRDAVTSGLANATVLIVRHAEKPEEGAGLTPAGEKRAHAYADYFRHFEIDGAPVKIDALVATTDTANSMRPRLTLELLGKALAMPVQQPCDDKDVKGQVRWLSAQPPGRATLVAWRHGKIPALIAALGGDPAKLLGGDAWPSTIYSWVVVLRYDEQGRLRDQTLVHEPEALNR